MRSALSVDPAARGTIKQHVFSTASRVPNLTELAAERRPCRPQSRVNTRTREAALGLKTLVQRGRTAADSRRGRRNSEDGPPTQGVCLGLLTIRSTFTYSMFKNVCFF